MSRQSWGSGAPHGSGMWGGYFSLQGPLFSYYSHICVRSFRISSLTDSLCSCNLLLPVPPSLLVSIALRLYCVTCMYYYYHHCIVIPLICQCDGVGWLPLTGLPWLCTLLVAFHLWLHQSIRQQPPNSSIDDEFNFS